MRANPNIVLDPTRPSGPRFDDISGRRFGRLVAVEYAGRDRSRQPYFRLRCDCGNMTVAYAGSVKRGATQSCGCLHSEATSKALRTHGHASVDHKTGEYRAWVQMKTRCFNPNYSERHLYGGRGITVCDRWCDSFEAFLADMGEKPSPTHSLDRFPNPNGNYEPGNCRWATPTQQANNRRTRRST